MNINNFSIIDYNDIWIPDNIKNGRINIANDNNMIFNKTIEKESILSETNTNSISQNLTDTDLSVKFFSKTNINKIQTKIIIDVYAKSNKQYNIQSQSEQELLIIMRSYYLQYGKNLPNDINSQIETLNKMVIDWSVDEIIKNIRQYISYKKDCSTLPMPMERAQLPTQKGTKTLEIKSFI
jgi:hypothetical protein